VTCQKCNGSGVPAGADEPCDRCIGTGVVADPVVVDQPDPIKNDRRCIQDLVIADIEARKAVGLERYGTLLQPFNGRDALMDAYAEALDLCQYLRQAIEERDAPKNTAPDGASADSAAAV
jgi:hypothetical protein